jgi:hypothetical protein
MMGIELAERLEVNDTGSSGGERNRAERKRESQQKVAREI